MCLFILIYWASSQASCLTLHTSSNWSSEEDLSLSSETEISFQGQVVGGKGCGSPVSTIPALDVSPTQLPADPGDPYSADELNLLEP